MSKDAALFSIHFFDCDIFCEQCGHVRNFKIFSQEPYNKTYGKSDIPPNKPLYCKCEACEYVLIYSTNEFAELKEDATFGLCKIWGKGNLSAGDQVFLEKENICTVSRVNEVSNSLPQVMLKKQNGESIELQADFFENSGSSLNSLYRIVPQDVQNTCLGDAIYHTETKLTGRTVGLEFGELQSIVVELENGEVVKIKNESEAHYLTDETLRLNAMWRCRDLPYVHNVQIVSSAKVLHVNCVLPNLKAAHELESIISSIPQIRCFIIHTAMEDSDANSKTMYKELLKNCVNICNCRIECKNQEVFISGFYSSPDVPENVHKALLKFPIKKIDLSELKKRSDIKTCKTINQRDCFIRISKIGKDTHIDGWIPREKERGKAKLAAFLCTYSFKMQDNLQVIQDSWLVEND